MVSRAAALSIAALLLASTLVLAYANHFDNGFYFDDAHTVVNNLWTGFSSFLSTPINRGNEARVYEQIKSLHQPTVIGKLG